MIGVLEAQPAGGVEAEAVDLGAAPRIAVADDDHPVARDQHLVIPVAPAGHAGREGVDRIDGRMPPPASETVNSRPRRRMTRMSPRILTMPPSSTSASWVLVMPALGVGYPRCR